MYATIFRNSRGLLTKRAELNGNGEVELTASAALYRGTYRTVSAPTVTELAAIIRDLTPNEAMAFGIPSSGIREGAVVTRSAMKGSPASAEPGVVARTLEHFSWPNGPGWLMLDVDLKGLPDSTLERLGPLSVERIRQVLIESTPSLGNAPMLGLPSASAFLYRASDNELLRGLTGVRLYLPAADASQIPELGRRIHDRLVLSGYGFPFVSKSGEVRIRSLVDTSVLSPVHLDFIGGAACGKGLEQRRGEPQYWNADSLRKLTPADIPPITSGEAGQIETIEKQIRANVAGEAKAARQAYVKAREAGGLRTSITWGEDGSISFLDGTHQIQLTDGSWVDVDVILANPDRYHGATCADPVDAGDPGQDARLAKIYTIGQTSGPAINSFAHGGAVYLLKASAGADFNDASDSSEGPNVIAQEVSADETERIAALIGQAARAFLLDLPSIADKQIIDRWRVIQAAATRDDPLKALFRRVVIPAAQRLNASEFGQFSVVLEASLLSNPDWERLDGQSKQLLLRAAFALFAPLGKLVDGLSDSPGPPLPIQRVDREYLVDDLIPPNSLVSLVGLPGSGKSFLAIELAARVAKTPKIGPEFFGGSAVKHGKAIYFTSEDAEGVQNRTAAWETVHGPVKDNLHLFGRVPPLSSLERTMSFMLAAIESIALSPDGPPIRLIVIDVLRAAIEGEENSSDVMGPAMAVASVLSRMTGATVLLVHHSALADPERGRGSSAFTAAQDFIGAVSQSDQGISLKVTKNKSGPAGQMLRWHLRDGVLHSGGLAPQTATRTGEACTLAAGQIIREIASDKVTISRRELSAALSEAHPSLFGSTVNPKTVVTRVSRALREAIDRGWISAVRGRYGLGAHEPPTAIPELEAVPT